jgi:hypothetical protein
MANDRMWPLATRFIASANDLRDCALYCQAHDLCRSVSYNDDTKECRAVRLLQFVGNESVLVSASGHIVHDWV